MSRVLLAASAAIGLLWISPEASGQSMSQELTFVSVPALRANVAASISVKLTDGWTGSVLSSRMVQFSVGEQFYLTSAGNYPTNSSGTATFRWTFRRPGKYRVVAWIPDGFGYIAQRKTILVNVQ